MEKRSWADLSPQQRTGIACLSVVQIGLLALTLWDVSHRSPDEVRGDRRMWAGLAFINWIGPLAYFLVGRKWTSCPLALSGVSRLFGDR